MTTFLRPLRALVLCAATAAAMSATEAVSETIPESNEPIKLAMNEWTGQHVTTMIAGELLKKMGYNVEYVTAGYFPQMKALETNEVTASLEVWLNTIGEHYNNAMASGKVEDIGELGLQSGEGWIYPTYVKEKCPGLPNWEALKKCADLFSATDTYPKGRLVDYPADWAPHNNERLAAFGLDFVAVPAGSEGAMIAEFKGAEARHEPILMMFWKPHWLFNDYDVEFTELPKWDPACETDPSWGTNPNATYDCGWNSGQIRKVAWIGMKDKWPAAYRLLSTFQITNEIQVPLLKAVDADGVDLEKAIQAWIEGNQSVWQPWIDKAQQ